MNSQEYIEVSVRIDPFTEEYAEILMAELAELPFESFETGDGVLKCYVQKELYSPQTLKLMLNGLDYDFDAREFSASLINAANWNAAWESGFSPITVDGECTIKAPYHKGLEKTRLNITINPNMAFGTGHHQTTYMMCRALLNNEQEIKGKTVMDIGCGTAVLAILAAKLGAGRVYAVDIDAVAVLSAHDNIRKNKVSRIAETHCGDASLLQAGSYDILLANINRNILLQDIPTYSRSLRKGGRLFVSGFFTEDLQLIAEAAEASGLACTGNDSLDNWCCAGFVKEI